MINALASIRLDEILRDADAAGASDLHLGTGEAPALRVDGRLQRSGRIVSSDDLESYVRMLLDERAVTLLQRRGHVDVAYTIENFGTFRVHIYRSRNVDRIAVRLFARSIPSLSELGLPASLGSFVRRRSGLLLIAGPTGCGKTTAMAALVDDINRHDERHVVTIEDPIEYVHFQNKSVVAQRQVGADVRNFAEALRGALREDPDVLVLGELRDGETMAAALTAAETGHLVIGTIHTNDAAQTVDRIVDAVSMGPQQIRAQLAQTLIAVVSLRLVCRARGPGRIAAAEIMLGTDAVRALIRDGKTHQLRNAIVTGRESGMQTLEAHLSDLVMRGLVDSAEARSQTERPCEINALEEPLAWR